MQTAATAKALDSTLLLELLLRRGGSKAAIRICSHGGWNGLASLIACFRHSKSSGLKVSSFACLLACGASSGAIIERVGRSKAALNEVVKVRVGEEMKTREGWRKEGSDEALRILRLFSLLLSRLVASLLYAANSTARSNKEQSDELTRTHALGNTTYNCDSLSSSLSLSRRFLVAFSSLSLSCCCHFLVANTVLTSQTPPPSRLASLVAVAGLQKRPLPEVQPDQVVDGGGS